MAVRPFVCEEECEGEHGAVAAFSKFAQFHSCAEVVWVNVFLFGEVCDDVILSHGGVLLCALFLFYHKSRTLWSGVSDILGYWKS